MKIKKSAVAIIRNQNDDMLFLKRFPYDRSFPDIYCLPGGKVEEDESLEAALCREVKEETNLDIVKKEYIGHHKFNNDTTIFYMHIFICEVAGDIKISDEHESYDFINLETTNKKIGENTIAALKILLPYSLKFSSTNQHNW